ncbi:hypothetical protein PLANPX_1100 [Lacipirellula parvula]|uniref:Uncharacterized protein n=1 Tax=Lacipirellula parvula TaxID=2650471 RepID=A0A5K7X4K5_9BACT|nr:hypothetical protein PLANPX_1100 [Lacipirellula parvula]
MQREIGVGDASHKFLEKFSGPCRFGPIPSDYLMSAANGRHLLPAAAGLPPAG